MPEPTHPALAPLEALRDEWLADSEEYLNRVGQHLAGGAVESCAEMLTAAIAKASALLGVDCDYCGPCHRHKPTFTHEGRP